jgi:hypothetical protein
VNRLNSKRAAPERAQHGSKLVGGEDRPEGGDLHPDRRGQGRRGHANDLAVRSVQERDQSTQQEDAYVQGNQPLPVHERVDFDHCLVSHQRSPASKSGALAAPAKPAAGAVVRQSLCVALLPLGDPAAS